MLIMTVLSTYVSFVWKYFLGVVIFVVLGGICCLIYADQIHKILKIHTHPNAPEEQITENSSNIAKKSSSWFHAGKLKSIEFYLYAVFLCLCSLYIDIIMAMYPYFIKSFSHISQFKYLLAISILYLSSFLTSVITRNSFVFNSIRIMMTIGLFSSTLAAMFFILGFVQVDFGVPIFARTCLTGISQMIG